MRVNFLNEYLNEYLDGLMDQDIAVSSSSTYDLKMVTFDNSIRFFMKLPDNSKPDFELDTETNRLIVKLDNNKKISIILSYYFKPTEYSEPSINLDDGIYVVTFKKKEDITPKIKKLKVN